MNPYFKLDTTRFRIISGLLILIAILVTIISYASGYKESWGGTYTYYNNYQIFKYSFINLINNANIYDVHPDQYADLYKYSPTFSMFMGLFYALPDWLGLGLWQVLNVVIFVLGVGKASFLSNQQKNVVMLFCLVEASTSLQSHQSNLLIAGLLLMAFEQHVKGQTTKAFTLIFLTVLIKLFTLVLLPILLLNRISPKQILNCAGIGLLLMLLPVLIIGPNSLMEQYKNWWVMLQNDYAGTPGHSLHGIVQDCLHLSIPKSAMNLIGLLLLVSYFAFQFFSHKKERHLNYFVFVGLWILVFNHKSESPTFIIAVSAAMVWMVTQVHKPMQYWWAFAFILCTSLISTDLFPPVIRNTWFEPWHVKVYASTLLLFILWISPLFKTNKITENQ